MMSIERIFSTNGHCEQVNFLQDNPKEFGALTFFFL